jgi:hypothetical protein
MVGVTRTVLEEARWWPVPLRDVVDAGGHCPRSHSHLHSRPRHYRCSSRYTTRDQKKRPRVVAAAAPVPRHWVL